MVNDWQHLANVVLERPLSTWCSSAKAKLLENLNLPSSRCNLAGFVKFCPKIISMIFRNLRFEKLKKICARRHGFVKIIFKFNMTYTFYQIDVRFVTFWILSFNCKPRNTTLMHSSRQSLWFLDDIWHNQLAYLCKKNGWKICVLHQTKLKKKDGLSSRHNDNWNLQGRWKWVGRLGICSPNLTMYQHNYISSTCPPKF